MRTPTSLLNRPGRAAAVVGAVLAVSAGATVAFVASASADEPGRCIQNVNVREKPDVNSRIVALCEAGTQVQVAETRDGFVHLTNLHGWAAQQYVSVNGRTPAPATERSGSRTAPGTENGRAPAGDRHGSGNGNTGGGHTGGGHSGGGNTGGGNSGGSGSSGSDAGDSGSNESGHNEGHGRGVGGLLG